VRLCETCCFFISDDHYSNNASRIFFGNIHVSKKSGDVDDL